MLFAIHYQGIIGISIHVFYAEYIVADDEGGVKAPWSYSWTSATRTPLFSFETEF